MDDNISREYIAELFPAIAYAHFEFIMTTSVKDWKNYKKIQVTEYANRRTQDVFRESGHPSLHFTNTSGGITWNLWHTSSLWILLGLQC